MEPNRDTIMEKGDCAYHQFWESGAPGAGADYESVYRFSDRYLVIYSFEDDAMGP